MWVLSGRFVVGAVTAEVGAEYQSFLDEEIERAVDGGGIDEGKLGSDAIDDVFGAQVLIVIGEENIPDCLSLPGEASAGRTKARRMHGRLVVVLVGCAHVSIMPPAAVAARPPRANSVCSIASDLQ